MSIITDHRGRRAVSNLGWVDHGAVWSFGSGDDEPRTIPLSDAKYLDLLAGKGPYFAAVHHWSGERLETRFTANLGAQPLVAALLQHGQIVARDWQTGQTLVAAGGFP